MIAQSNVLQTVWKRIKKSLGLAKNSDSRRLTKEIEIPSLEAHVEASFGELLQQMRCLTVGDVMVPRADLVAVSKEDTFDDVLARFLETKAQALPVFRHNLDDIIGAVSIHDILAFAVSKPADASWARKLFPVSFVPASMPAPEAFLALSEQQAPFVLIVDEHGGVDGLASQKALVKALGTTISLWDEEAEMVETVEWNEHGGYLVDGRLPLETFEEELNLSLNLSEREEGIETIGGFICSLAGRVPSVKEVITHPTGATFEILDADARRIKRIVVTLPGK